MTSISTHERQVVKEQALEALNALQSAVTEAIDRKRRLGQYWVVWDGEKPVEVHPEDAAKSGAE